MIDVSIQTRSKVSMSDNGRHFRSGAATSYPSVREGATRLQSILPGMRTPYHLPHLTVEIANELWNAGFRDIDVPDEQYQTPLMMIASGLIWRDYNDRKESIEAVLWLYQKGAALHRPCCATLPPGRKDVGYIASRSERRAIHIVATALKDYFLFIQEPTRNFSALEGSYPAAIEHIIDDLSLDCRQFLRKILLDDSPDGCLCACSGHGCTPMTSLLKRSWSTWRTEEDETVVTAWRRRWFFENVPTEHLSTVSSQKILRLITFERLGLRHTCREFEIYEFRTLEPEEVAEIRDEDH